MAQQYLRKVPTDAHMLRSAAIADALLEGGYDWVVAQGGGADGSGGRRGAGNASMHPALMSPKPSRSLATSSAPSPAGGRSGGVSSVGSVLHATGAVLSRKGSGIPRASDDTPDGHESDRTAPHSARRGSLIGAVSGALTTFFLGAAAAPTSHSPRERRHSAIDVGGGLEQPPLAPDGAAGDSARDVTTVRTLRQVRIAGEGGSDGSAGASDGRPSVASGRADGVGLPSDDALAAVTAPGMSGGDADDVDGRPPTRDSHGTAHLPALQMGRRADPRRMLVKQLAREMLQVRERAESGNDGMSLATPDAVSPSPSTDRPLPPARPSMFIRSLMRIEQAVCPPRSPFVVWWTQHISDTAYLILQVPLFTYIVIMAVFANTVALAVTYYGMPHHVEEGVTQANYVFVAIFTLELALNLLAHGLSGYFTDSFRVFDGAVVILSIVDALPVTPTVGLSALRLTRLLRIFRVARRWKSMQAIVAVAAKTLPSFGWTAVLLALSLFIFSVLGLQAFGSEFAGLPPPIPQQNFATLHNSFLLVFTLLVGEGMDGIIYQTISATSGVAIIYFVIWLVLGQYILLNLVLALLLDGFTESDVSAKELERRDEFKTAVALIDASLAELQRRGVGESVKHKRFLFASALKARLDAVRRKNRRGGSMNRSSGVTVGSAVTGEGSVGSAVVPEAAAPSRPAHPTGDVAKPVPLPAVAHVDSDSAATAHETRLVNTSAGKVKARILPAAGGAVVAASGKWRAVDVGAAPEADPTAGGMQVAGGDAALLSPLDTRLAARNPVAEPTPSSAVTPLSPDSQVTTAASAGTVDDAAGANRGGVGSVVSPRGRAAMLQLRTDASPTTLVPPTPSAASLMGHGGASSAVGRAVSEGADSAAGTPSAHGDIATPSPPAVGAAAAVAGRSTSTPPPPAAGGGVTGRRTTRGSTITTVGASRARLGEYGRQSHSHRRLPTGTAAAGASPAASSIAASVLGALQDSLRVGGAASSATDRAGTPVTVAGAAGAPAGPRTARASSTPQLGRTGGGAADDEDDDDLDDASRVAAASRVARTERFLRGAGTHRGSPDVSTSAMTRTPQLATARAASVGSGLDAVGSGASFGGGTMTHADAGSPVVSPSQGAHQQAVPGAADGGAKAPAVQSPHQPAGGSGKDDHSIVLTAVDGLVEEVDEETWEQRRERLDRQLPRSLCCLRGGNRFRQAAAWLVDPDTLLFRIPTAWGCCKRCNRCAKNGCRIPPPTPTAAEPEAGKPVKGIRVTFDRIIMVTILFSTIFLAVESPQTDNTPGVLAALRGLEAAFLSIFCVEMVAKVIAMGFVMHPGSYLRDGYNRLDFIVVITAVADLIATSAGGGANIGFLRVLRILRTLRPLRLLSRNRGMRLVIDALWLSLWPILNILSVLGLFFTIFAITGVQLFSGALSDCSDPAFPPDTPLVNCTGTYIDARGNVATRGVVTPSQNFDHFGNAMLHLFIMATGGELHGGRGGEAIVPRRPLHALIPHRIASHCTMSRCRGLAADHVPGGRRHRAGAVGLTGALRQEGEGSAGQHICLSSSPPPPILSHCRRCRGGSRTTTSLSSSSASSSACSCSWRCCTPTSSPSPAAWRAWGC